MTPAGWLRRAGRLGLEDGGLVLWSVAEGRRGRRWRSLRLDAEGRVLSDLLLELDPTGEWARLELANRSGILTLHPDAGGVHGNVVGPDGVRHLALAWEPGWWLAIAGEPVAAAALAGSAGSGGLVVQPDLSIERVDGPRPAAGAVRPEGGLGPPDDGLPGDSWPLEEETHRG
jgi:hypothetical protein